MQAVCARMVQKEGDPGYPALDLAHPARVVTLLPRYNLPSEYLIRQQ